MRRNAVCSWAAVVGCGLAALFVAPRADAQVLRPPVFARPFGAKTYGGGSRGAPYFTAAGVCLLVGVPSFAIGLGVGLSSQPPSTPALVVGAVGAGLTLAGVSLGVAGLVRQWTGGISSVSPGRYGVPVLAWGGDAGATRGLTVGWALAY